MECLEKEMVPAVLRMTSRGAEAKAATRDYLKTVRSLWKREVEALESCLVEIVDPTAYCVVGQRLVQRAALKLKQCMYSQDHDLLKGLLAKLVKISQSCVDFAWQVERGADASPLANDVTDNHPIVKTERSI